MSSENLTLNERWLVPAGSGYWAMLDAVGLPRGRARHEALAYQFEPWLPVPLESVVPRFLTLDGDAVLAVALPRASLLDLLDKGVHSVAIEGSPDFLSPEITAGAIARLRALEFLTGDLTPEPLRRVRRRSAGFLGGGIALALLLLCAGLLRRAEADRTGARQERDRADAIYRAALGRSAEGAILPLPLLLDAELRKRDQQLGSMNGAGAGTVFEADTALSQLLAGWPADEAGLHVESLVAASGALTVRGTAPTTEQVSRLVEQLGRLPRAHIEEPSVRAETRGAAFTLRITLGGVP